MIREINKKKFILENRKPFSDKINAYMREVWLSEWIYTSNKLAGSTLSLQETLVILRGEYILDKTIDDHLSVNRHEEVIKYMEKMARFNTDMYSDKICYVNNLFCDGDDFNYRDSNPVKLELKYIPPHFKEVSTHMKELNKWYLQESKDINPVLKGIILHNQIIKICPFKEDNEKTARALLNYELMKAGYPPIDFNLDEGTYNEFLSLYMKTGKADGFYEVVLKKLYNRLEFFLNVTSQE